MLLRTVRIDFNDCAIANDGFAAVNINVRGTQLEGGELSGYVEANQIGSAVFMGTFMSKRSLFTGGRMPGMIPFVFMASGDSYYQGGPSYGRELCGYKEDCDETHVAWQGEMCCTYLPREQFKAHLIQCGAHNALERFASTHSTMLCAAGTQLMERQFRQGLAGELKSDSQVYSLMTTLLEQAEIPRPNEEGCKNEPMLREFVQLAHENAAGEPLALAEVAQMLHVGKSTLRRACTDAYGMSVVGLMRRVRLEQCRLAFVKPGKATTVESVRRKYRFTNKGRFARLYQEAFGELPSETYMRGQGQLKLKGI